jgi:hypothetical protein
LNRCRSAAAPWRAEEPRAAALRREGETKEENAGLAQRESAEVITIVNDA